MRPLILLFCTLWTLSALAQAPCTLDPSFDLDGRLIGDGSRIGEQMLVQPDGKIIVAANPFGNGPCALKRYNDDGSPDPSWGSAGQLILSVGSQRTDVNGMALHQGTLYVCGSTTANSNTYPFVAAVSSSGALLPGFGGGGIQHFASSPALYTGTAIAIGDDGKIYVTGLEWLDNLYVLRLTSTGQLDNTFDGDGVAYIPTNNTDHWFETTDIAIDPNGLPVITGKKYKANNGSPITPFWHVMAARFTATGALDPSFGTGGIALLNSNPSHFNEGRRILPLPTGGYVITGNTWDGVDYDYTALRLSSTGAIDPTFGSSGWAIVDLMNTQDTEYSLTGDLLPDGRILITGNQGDGDTVYFNLLLLTASGQRDLSFAPGGVFRNIFGQNNNSSAQGMCLAPGNKIIMGGYTRTCVNGTCGPLYMALARYTYSPLVGLTAPAPGIDPYPNPARAGQAIRLGRDAAQLRLLDSQGRVLAQWDAPGDALTLPELAPGLYFLQGEDDSGSFGGRLLIR